MVVQLQTIPKATQITLKKGEDGVWSGTTPEPLAPDLYFYYLVMDGLDIHDPSAKYFKGQGPKWGCLLEVPGDTPQDFELRGDIPHGTMTHAWIDSKVLGELRGLNIYTPPSYLVSTKKYPVLYLLHGVGGNEETWVKAGFIDRMLDSWIADGRINEVVVVITSNRVNRGTDESTNSLTGYFTKEIMPYVEKRYRVETGRQNTAVAGFSMGGGQTLSLAFGLPERFGALACLSGAIGNRGGARDGGGMIAQYPVLQDAKKANELFPVFYVACGEQDSLIKAAKSFDEELTKAGIKHTYTTSPGVHTMKADWKALEAFLHDFTKAE